MAHVDPRAPSGFAIRPATKADSDAVAAVVLAAAEEAWSSFLGRERIIEANRGRAHPADLVAVDDGGVFGFVAWDVETGEITRLYVHPRGQRRGAGRALLGQALEALAAAGRRQAWLNTEHRNAGARRFYTREGWVEQGPPRRRNWHGAELVEPRYVKTLSRATR
jgi:ribosomal protein S18 acetylase RimI-like enzyme